VETIWIELPAPHAGIEPVSETRVRNGIFCCRDRAAKRAHSVAALLRVSQILYNYRVWVVETIWIELPAPHAGIEPVSEARVRNGIFCCRDGAAKWADSPRLREQRPR